MSTTPASFDLSQHGLTVTEVHHNLPPGSRPTVSRYRRWRER
jgi:hypothetical protein